MNKLKYIRVQKQDGTYTSHIPIAPDAEDVLMRNGNTLQDTIGNLDVNSADDITTQLSRKIDTENAVPVITSTTTSWLNTNVTPVGSAVVVDSSLSTSGAAADAKAVGDGLDEVSDSIPDVDDTLSITGAAADAKKTGDEIAGLKEDLSDITEGTAHIEKSALTKLSAYIGPTSHQIKMDDDCRLVYFECQPNTKYTVHKVLSARFRVGYLLAVLPTEDVMVYGYVADNAATSLTLTTGSDALYGVVYYYDGENDSLSENEIYESLDITYADDLGTTAIDKVARKAIADIGIGLSDEIKSALLACFNKVVWIDEHGQTYYDELEQALYNGSSGTEDPLYEWDFTQSLTDLRRGQTATLHTGEGWEFPGKSAGTTPPKQGATGLVFDDAQQLCRLFNTDVVTSDFIKNKTIQIDVASLDVEYTPAQNYGMRFLMMSTPNNEQPNYNTFDVGLVYSNSSSTNSAWRILRKSYDYMDHDSKLFDTDINAISGHTISVYFSSDGIVTMYIDGVSKGSSDNSIYTSTQSIFKGLQIGAGGRPAYGGCFYNAVITGVRIYNGEVA